MRILNCTIIIALTMLIAGYALADSGESASSKCEKQDTLDKLREFRSKPVSERYLNTSIIRLIASPASYDGHKVTVSGYLEGSEFTQILYIDKEAAKAELSENALLVELRNAKYSGMPYEELEEYYDKYWSISGTFSANLSDDGEVLGNGWLDDVTLIQEVGVKAVYCD